MSRLGWIRVGAVLACGLGTGAAVADPLIDLHMPVIPRTDAETARIARVTAPTTDFTTAERFEANPAGAATVPARRTDDAFSQPAATIPLDRQMEFQLGHALFSKLWVAAPSSTLASDGLGPLYNARSCLRCHVRNGRGQPPGGPKGGTASLLMQLSIPGGAEVDEIRNYISTRPDPIYGRQIQNLATPGLRAEAALSVDYVETEIALSGGETAYLRAPRYELEGLSYGPLHADVMLSPRIAPQMIGLGLLEAIPAADILALADPEDSDADGISGRAQIVMSRAHGVPMLGRFGLKAGAPSVLEQSASAFQSDIGISSPLLPQGFADCTEAQAECRAAPDGNTAVHDGAEIGQTGLDLTVFYAANLAVPARRDVDDRQVLRGKQVFYETGCIACHTPKFVTHRLEGQPAQSFQLIWPYSDLLLHDIGEELADHRPEARAKGREWRTPPLWGIGLTETVSGHSFFLHDGRARSLLEAILWHGGEAEAQKQTVITMPPADRAALIRFLESL